MFFYTKEINYAPLGKKARLPNSGFAKKRVQWLIEHSTSHQLLWCIDSLVLRNPPLRQAPKQYL
jgi:hypothetical protein